MCGIAGLASSTVPVDAVLLASMRDTMIHRGPDDTGAWMSADRRIGLAHRRLSVLDLSDSAHQPMCDPARGLSMVFNGEIYNFQELRGELESLGHAFRSTGDTEVALAAYAQWGWQCLDRLEGMFAIAIHDSARDALFLARDRSGEKPLYYRHHRHGFAFASELKALMADRTLRREVDPDALRDYLAYGYVIGARSMLRGVAKLPPAHCMTYKLRDNSLQLRRYWDLPPFETGRAATIDELCDELEVLLRQSVRRRLLADVPVGVMLSGGVDSSLIAALAAEVSGKRVKTFTASFPGAAREDEAPHARLVASHIGTEHTELRVDASSVDLLPELARQYDEPLADHSMVPTYALAREVRRQVTVALGGDGGDELFGGYSHYKWLLWMERARTVLPGTACRLVQSMASALPTGFRGRHYLTGLGAAGSEMVCSANMLFSRAESERMLGGAAKAAESPKGAHLRHEPSLLRSAASLDFRTYFPDDILVKVDRASMLASLEVRAPLLDRKVIEFAFRRVPDAFKVTLTERKRLLRRLAGRRLPRTLDLKRKQGFTPPLKSWFRGDWSGFLIEAVESSPFEKSFVRSLVRGERSGLANSRRLFALVMFELWRREYCPSV
jgi:asparagine synthase (glutamine-hydrolysing)